MNRSMVGLGRSTGKRCLAIDQINLKGVVKSENGMIAVVVNALDKPISCAKTTRSSTVMW